MPIPKSLTSHNDSILKQRFQKQEALSRVATFRKSRSHFRIGILKTILSFVIGAFLCSASLAGIPASPSRPSHQSLDWYPDEAGKPQPIERLEDWQKRRAAIIAGFEEVAGPLPSRENLPDLDPQVIDLHETEFYIRQTITFVSEHGDRTPAFLYFPKDIELGEKRPGILALHPTGALGKKIVDGQSKRPNRAYARELAERGYVVIAPDYPSFGDYADYDFESDHYSSGGMKGIWNHIRSVDLLVSLPEVDSDRIAAIGHSLGGHNAIFTAIFDPRIQVIVSSCGWTPLHDYYGGTLTGWTSARYFPAIRDRYNLDPDKVPFDFYELVAALAPAAFFSNSPLQDHNFDWRGVEKAAPKIRRIYELHSVPEKLRIAYPNAKHDFPTPVREESYEFLKRWLK